MTEQDQKSLSLRVGAVLSIVLIASGLLVYGYIAEPTWLEVAKASIASILGG